MYTLKPNVKIFFDELDVYAVTSQKHAVSRCEVNKMEFTKENMRFYIFMRSKLSESPTQIHESLQAVCGDRACSYQTVCRWGKEFGEGKQTVFDEPRSGRRNSVVNERNIADIRNQIEEDPHISVRELSDTSGLSVGLVHTIITDELHMKKICARWIPHLLTPDQKRERVRCATELLNMFEPNGPKRLTDIVTGDETWFPFFIIPPKRMNRMWIDEKGDRPVVLSPGFQSRKRMFTVFFNYRGPVAIDILPQGTTMTSQYYVQTVLPQVKNTIDEQRPTIGMSRTFHLHDNAAPHKSRATTQALQEQGIRVLPHPAYSPDLAPCDFWLFPILKDRLAGRKFERIQDLAKAVKSELRTIPEEEYHNAFRKWLKRLELCVQSGGEYFEGL